VTVIAYALGLRTGEFVTEVAAAAGAALMAVLLLPESGPVSRGLVSVLEIGVLRKLGDISLSWYMCHYAVILWFRAHAEWVLFDSFATMILAWVVVCVPISVLALLSHTFIETPAMNRKRMAS
jgi:peptidoglycan/LPS O-acetylase OafA/YrhL